jgi:hypothetical protein
MDSPQSTEGVDPPNEQPSWTKAIEPGHCFVWFNAERVTLYSTVLPRPSESAEPANYYFTKTFTISAPTGFHCYVRDDLPAKLLSEEQMNVAKTLGWPNDNDGLLRVLGVPAS